MVTYEKIREYLWGLLPLEACERMAESGNHIHILCLSYRTYSKPPS